MLRLLLLLILLLLAQAARATTYFDPTIPPVHDHPRPSFFASQRYAASERAAFRSTNAFLIQFIGPLPPPDVITAVLAATTILNAFFALPAPITIGVQWADLSTINVHLLGMGGSAATCLHPTLPHILVPAALYVALTGAPNCPGINSPLHAQLTLNSHPPAPWFTGLSGSVPSSDIDLITVALHEMMHGMGFESFVAGDGSIASAPDGFIYDAFCFAGVDASWPAIGAPVAQQLTDVGALTSHVTFRGNVTAGGIDSFDVYTPSTFAAGTSLSHVRPTLSIINRLMFPAIGFGQAWHHPGAAVYVAMASMGYPMHAYVDYFNGAVSYTANGCTTCGAASLATFAALF